MNLFKLLIRLFVPPFDEWWVKARLEARAELTWQPYLFLSSWLGALLTIIYGQTDIIPPGDRVGFFDLVWLFAALTTPITGFAAVVVIKNGCGRWRYVALWVRMASSIGLMTAICSYLVERSWSGHAHPFEQSILFGSVVFLFVLIVGDIRFLAMTERLAGRLLQVPDEHE